MDLLEISKQTYPSYLSFSLYQNLNLGISIGVDKWFMFLNLRILYIIHDIYGHFVILKP